MGQRIREIAKKICEECGIPVEVKKIGNSHYLYRDTTRWDRDKKRICVSEYIVRINENGLIEKIRRSIYEFGNSLLISVIRNIVPELKRCFPDQWTEIVAMPMIMCHDNKQIRYMRSAWEKLCAFTQIDYTLRFC